MCYLPALRDLEFDTRLSGGNGRNTTTLSEDWAIWGPNVGYLAAVALRAAGMEAAIKRPGLDRVSLPGRRSLRAGGR